MKKFLMVITVFALLLCSGCSEEPEVTESSSESSSNQIMITPEEPSESSSSETESKSSSEPESSESSSGETSSEAEIPPAPEIPTPEDSSVLILVNPWNYIPEDYVPELEKVQGKYNMDIKAAESARNLVAAAKEAGFNMQLCSAYRTVEKSAQLYKNKVNEYIGYGYSEADAKVEAATYIMENGLCLEEYLEIIGK